MWDIMLSVKSFQSKKLVQKLSQILKRLENNFICIQKTSRIREVFFYDSVAI